MIALLCSVETESALLLSKTTVTREMMLGSKKIISGKICGRDIVSCAGGMGKANAAHTATLLITQYDPEVLIVFGIGGAYLSSGARVGDLAIASEEIAGDEGVLTGDGFKDPEYIGIPLIKTENKIVYSRYFAPELTLAESLKSLGSSPHSGKVHVGTFVTLSTCTGTSMRARELEERYHGLCENMEGAAAAHVAALHKVPWLEIRGISNLVEERDLKKWDIVKAAESCQNAVMRILEGWKR